MSFLGAIGAAGGFAVPYSDDIIPGLGIPPFGTRFDAGVARRSGKSVIAYVGVTLAARAGLFNTNGAAAAADSGALVSAAPLATQHGLPLNFGPGRGRWTPTDLMRIRVEIYDPMDADVAASTQLHVALMRVTNDPTFVAAANTWIVDYVPGLATTETGTLLPPAADLVIGIHNRGAGASGELGFSIRLVYDHSLVWGG